MSIFDDFERRVKRERRVEVTTSALSGIIAVFFVGWILFLTYNAFAPDGLPYMGLWTGFGIVFLFNYAANRLRGDS